MICVVAFVLLCGCISHLTLAPETRDVSFKNILALYQQGVSGKSGGILCGILAMLLQWLCGKMLSYVILGVAAVFTLLGAMQFTIPSIIRAIRNRPRAEWEDEEPEETAEPAAIVVNHIANKHMSIKNASGRNRPPLKRTSGKRSPICSSRSTPTWIPPWLLLP